MESFSQILFGEQYIKKINKDAINLQTKDFIIYFGKDWSHNAAIVVKPKNNDDEYFCKISYTELDHQQNFKGLTSVQTLQKCLSKGRFLTEYVGYQGIRVYWFKNKSHLRRWRKNMAGCCSLYLQLHEE